MFTLILISVGESVIINDVLLVSDVVATLSWVKLLYLIALLFISIELLLTSYSSSFASSNIENLVYLNNG